MNNLKIRYGQASENDINVAKYILLNMPEQKKRQLDKQLNRNAYLTSAYQLGDFDLTDYLGKTSKDSGFYLVLRGARSSFCVYMNNDFKYIRKPAKVEAKQILSGSLDEGFFFKWNREWKKGVSK